MTMMSIDTDRFDVLAAGIAEHFRCTDAPMKLDCTDPRWWLQIDVSSPYVYSMMLMSPYSDDPVAMVQALRRGLGSERVLAWAALGMFDMHEDLIAA